MICLLKLEQNIAVENGDCHKGCALGRLASPVYREANNQMRQKVYCFKEHCKLTLETSFSVLEGWFQLE